MDVPAIIFSSLERAPWGWSLLLIALVTLIKIWPVIQLQTMNAAATLRGERRDEIRLLTERLDQTDSKLKVAVQHIHQLDLKLVGTVAAYRILHDDMTENYPESAALAQARILFATTWDGPVSALGELSG